MEQDCVEHQNERKQLFVDLKSKCLINGNYYDKIYLFPNFHIEFTIEVTDEPEDGDDWVVDTHVVDLDVFDMSQEKGECVDLNIQDLINEDKAAVEEDVKLPNVGKMRVQNIQKSLLMCWQTFLELQK